MLHIDTRHACLKRWAGIALPVLALLTGSLALPAKAADSPDDPFAPIQARLDGLADRLDPERNFGRANTTDFRAACLAMLLDYGRQAVRRKAPDLETLLALAKQQCRDLEKLALGKEDRGEAPLCFHEGPYLGLVNNEVGFLFRTDGRTACLVALYHARRKHEFLLPTSADCPLWELEYKPVDSGDLRVSGQTPAQVTAEARPGELESEIRLVWEFDRPRVRVRLSLKLETINRMADARLDVFDQDPASGIARITFPSLGRIGVDGSAEHDFLVLPHLGGQLYADPGRGADDQQEGEMQMLAYHTDQGAGLLIHADDPMVPSDSLSQRYQPAPETPQELQSAIGLGTGTKVLLAQGDSGQLRLGIRYSVPEPGVRSQTYSCRARLGCFTGTWYDAALLYRTWALRQPWAPKELFWARRDVPVWLKQNDCVLRTSGDAKEDLAWIAQARPKLAAPGLVECLMSAEPQDSRRAATAGLLADVGLPWVARLLPPQHPWTEKDLDNLAAGMLPQGLRGLCLDGLGLSGPIQARREFVQRVRGSLRKHNPEFVLLLGGCHERFLDACDGFLVTPTVTPSAAPAQAGKASVPTGKPIPLFAAVYGDHGARYGFRDAAGEDHAGHGRFAEELAWGEQIGLVRPAGDATGPPGEWEARLTHVRWRQTALNYLAYGRMLRAPQVEWATKPDAAGTEPPVVASAWQAPGDTMALVFVHTAEGRGPARFTARVDWEEYGAASDGSSQLCRLSPQGKIEPLGSIAPDLRVQESLEPWEVRILLVLPGSARR